MKSLPNYVIDEVILRSTERTFLKLHFFRGLIEINRRFLTKKEYLKDTKDMVSTESFEKEIQDILKQLIRVYKPLKVVLFGSLVNGNMREGTDIDLFIIKKDVPDLGVDRIRQLDALIKYKLATDFIVYKPEEVEKRLNLGDPFVKNILKEGKVLYDAK